MPPHPHKTLSALGSLLLITSISACDSHEPPSVASRTSVPTPDLCQVLHRDVVAMAMHGKPGNCATSGGRGGFTTRFTGTARLRGGRAAATLSVSLEPRHAPKTGADRWPALGRPAGRRVSLIGVGESAVFDPGHPPQLRTVDNDVIISIALRLSGAAVPQAKLPDNLLALAQDAVAAARSYRMPPGGDRG